MKKNVSIFSLMLTVVVLMFSSCGDLFDKNEINGNWISVDDNGLYVMFMQFNSETNTGRQTTYNYQDNDWKLDVSRSFTYNYIAYSGYLEVTYTGYVDEDYQVSAVTSQSMFITINGKQRTFYKVQSVDVTNALGEIEDKLPDSAKGHVGSINVPTNIDYAPKTSNVRGYYFEAKTSTQNLTVYFEGAYSVDPQRTTINGEKTMAEYEYQSVNIAKIKYGSGKKEVMMLYFFSDNGGTAVYNNTEVGTFTAVSYN